MVFSDTFSPSRLLLRVHLAFKTTFFFLAEKVFVQNRFYYDSNLEGVLGSLHWNFGHVDLSVSFGFGSVHLSRFVSCIPDSPSFACSFVRVHLFIFLTACIGLPSFHFMT